jgi:hypothetical protein
LAVLLCAVVEIAFVLFSMLLFSKHFHFTYEGKYIHKRPQLEEFGISIKVMIVKLFKSKSAEKIGLIVDKLNLLRLEYIINCLYWLFHLRACLH